ncbi:MAG: hypothetical protein ACTSUX_03900 [Promethearchaeota archaeon]
MKSRLEILSQHLRKIFIAREAILKSLNIDGTAAQLALELSNLNDLDKE